MMKTNAFQVGDRVRYQADQDYPFEGRVTRVLIDGIFVAFDTYKGEAPLWMSRRSFKHISLLSRLVNPYDLDPIE